MIPQNIPINGRIAIVDDQPEQALPIMNLFAKLQIPYVYYDSEARNLPDPGTLYNDIRILFLDINLIDNSRRKAEELRSKLVGVLDRIISDENYPYLIIYWSREADEYDDLVREIFANDPLKNKKPIGFFSLNKQDYWSMDGSPTEAYDELIPTLFSRIETEIGKNPIYAHLLNWENQVHISADKTLEEIFKLKIEGDWNPEAGLLFYKLALAYAGKQLKNIPPVEQIKSAFFSLNTVFTDSLEDTIANNLRDKDYVALEENKAEHNLIYTLNRKLLLADDVSSLSAPGIVLSCSDNGEDDNYKGLLNDCFNRRFVEEEISKDNREMEKSALKKATDSKSREIREAIRSSWEKIFLVITPLCDYAQNKYIFHKLVKGIIIDAKFGHYINRSSEAIFISPIFRKRDDEVDNILILDFRHYLSYKEMPAETVAAIFRVRQQLLSEIQSKLSRHINRQGILFLE